MTKAERVKELTNMLDENVRSVFTSENYLNYLEYMKTFHKYSARNQMLIRRQRPEATLVKGYKTWESDKKYKRHVKKGEKAIWILAPMSFKRTVNREEINPETNETAIVEKEILVPSYRPVAVYDIGQTEGDDIPIIHTFNAKHDYEYYDDFVGALTKASPVPISFGDTGRASGYYDLTNKKIVIDQNLNGGTALHVMVHEITHALLHDCDGDTEKDKRTKEVEAESVSYVVCSYYGIDTGDIHFEYIANWSSDKELKELYSSLDIIQKTSNKLIDEIDKHMDVDIIRDEQDDCQDEQIELLA